MLKGQTLFLRAWLLTLGIKAEILDFSQANPFLRYVPAVGGSRLKSVRKQFSLSAERSREFSL